MSIAYSLLAGVTPKHLEAMGGCLMPGTDDHNVSTIDRFGEKCIECQSLNMLRKDISEPNMSINAIPDTDGDVRSHARTMVNGRALSPDTICHEVPVDIVRRASSLVRAVARLAAGRYTKT